MRTKKFLKRMTSLIVAAFMAATMSSCFDLGEFEDEEDYYASFGDVKLVYQNPTSLVKDIQTKEYDVRDYFYNSNTGENFSYGDISDDEPDEGKDIPQLPYVYMAIPVESDFNMDSLALYFNAMQSGNLKISIYLVDALPSGGSFKKIKLFGDPEYQEKLDGEGNPILDEYGKPILEAVLYDDPDETFLVAEESIYMKQNEWDSVIVDRWNAKNTISVKKSQFILLKFTNNSGEAETADSAIAFRMTNLLVRTVS